MLATDHDKKRARKVLASLNIYVHMHAEVLRGRESRWGHDVTMVRMIDGPPMVDSRSV
jgi:hypothetical protein